MEDRGRGERKFYFKTKKKAWMYCFHQTLISFGALICTPVFWKMHKKSNIKVMFWFDWWIWYQNHLLSIDLEPKEEHSDTQLETKGGRGREGGALGSRSRRDASWWKGNFGRGEIRRRRRRRQGVKWRGEKRRENKLESTRAIKKDFFDVSVRLINFSLPQNYSAFAMSAQRIFM